MPRYGKENPRRMTSPSFPPNLPVPHDDGACNHLLLKPNVPPVSLLATDATSVNLFTIPGLTIVFCYPRTAGVNEMIPDSWNSIPGARGCTPQACSFRDNMLELKRLGVARVYGLSTQSLADQREAHSRLHLAYSLLNDEKHELITELGLPTFEWNGKRLVKRITLAIHNGQIVHHWYPVFPPDRNVDDVLRWLAESTSGRNSTIV